MNILFAASESVPYCKTGGLADVVGALTQVLAQKNHQVRLVLPFYRQIQDGSFPITYTKKRVQILLGGTSESVQIWVSEPAKNLAIYFLGADRFFDRAQLYGEGGSDYPDNDRRFILASRAVPEVAKAMGFRPDVMHCHDWQTGLVPVYLKTLYRHDPFFEGTGIVFTIHNMAYQGLFSRHSFALTGIPWSEYHIKGLEFYGQANFLKAGIVYSDFLNTVSPAYAKEISTDPRFGRGLEGLLHERRHHFCGILNGLDTDIWNPATDPFIVSNFDRKTVSARAQCKSDLQRSVKLEADDRTPLLGFIGRLDPQKGIDILVEIAPSLFDAGVQMVVLGSGLPHYMAALASLQSQFPDQMRLETKFSESLAHKIYAGSDLFLMPSHYEPCGLGQLIAMRYGAIPVVTPTGGLLDTVAPMGRSKKGTGFVARDPSAETFYTSLTSALETYEKRDVWSALQRRAMSSDFSWSKSLPKYLELYKAAHEWRLAKIH